MNTRVFTEFHGVLQRRKNKTRMTRGLTRQEAVKIWQNQLEFIRNSETYTFFVFVFFCVAFVLKYAAFFYLGVATFCLRNIKLGLNYEEFQAELVDYENSFCGRKKSSE